MAHLIDKDALVAEIEKRRNKHFNSGGSPSSEYCYEDDEILDIIDTLEVKEVDYDKVLTEYLGNFENASIGHRLSIRRTAKHFFELGLKSQKGEDV